MALNPRNNNGSKFQKGGFIVLETEKRKWTRIHLLLVHYEPTNVPLPASPAATPTQKRVSYHGAKNLRNTVLPSVSEAKFSGVSSRANDEAAMARKKVICLSIVGVGVVNAEILQFL